MTRPPALHTSLAELTDRAQHILRLIIDEFVDTGEPVGSRTLSHKLGQHNLNLSAATIRNVMADLEDLGLLYSPHTSAGRMPTDAGLRLFVNGLLECGNLPEDERRSLESQSVGMGRPFDEMLDQAVASLSGLSGCASLVLAPKADAPIKQIEFVALSPGRALLVLVHENGQVENRVLDIPVGMATSQLVMASNYLNARLAGKTMQYARQNILDEMAAQQTALDSLTQKLVASGLASWSAASGQLIVRGQANLLTDIKAMDELEQMRGLFAALEARETMVKLLEAAQNAAGVQIFIGRESSLFEHTGCSLVIAPYMNSRQHIVGAIGVIGPTRINYARIIPMVDYTATIISRLMGK